jgi:hypothetical protein
MAKLRLHPRGFAVAIVNSMEHATSSPISPRASAAPESTRRSSGKLQPASVQRVAWTFCRGKRSGEGAPPASGGMTLQEIRDREDEALTHDIMGSDGRGWQESRARLDRTRRDGCVTRVEWATGGGDRMAVEQTCRVNSGAVILQASAGEFLEYRVVAASQGVEYQVVSVTGAVILSSADCGPPCVRRWPSAPASPGRTSHTLALQFFDEQSLTFEVDRMNASGEVLQEVKRCRYDNRGDPDDFFDPLEINVR